MTYRWDDSFVGGAELHHRRLANELDDAGHQVRITTTNGGHIQNFCHWAVLWDLLKQPSSSKFTIHRSDLPPRNHPHLLGMMARFIQKRFEREAATCPQSDILPFFDPPSLPPGAYLSHGWHYPEFQSGGPVRWSHPRAVVVVRGEPSGAPTALRIRGYNPKPRSIAVESSLGGQEGKPLPAGDFDITFPLKPAPIQFLSLTISAWRPLKEFRSLGVLVNSITIVEDGKELHAADLSEDLKDRAREFPEAWHRFLHQRAENRPRIYNTVIDSLRGPRTAFRNRSGEDSVRIFCNLPWATISHVQGGDLAMPLWHIDDEFYYWKHWTEALRRAKFVLANTPYTAQNFFPKLSIRAHFVGPPIWQPERFPTPRERDDFRALHGITTDEVLVLTVCRKSGEKRYEAIAHAVANLARAGAKIRMIGIGPDQDGRPFQHQGCRWLGQQTGDELQLAYAACDVFCLMSESESFGMVIPEAWHHEKPVVVNRRCGPSASLVADGVDGFLAVPGVDLEEKLAQLANSAELRVRIGAAGKKKALANYVRGAAANRLIAAMQSEGMKVDGAG